MSRTLEAEVEAPLKGSDVVEKFSEVANNLGKLLKKKKGK